MFVLIDRNESLLEDWYVFGQIQRIGKRELIGTSTFKVTLTEPQIIFNKRELLFRVDVSSNGDKSYQTGSNYSIILLYPLQFSYRI